MGKGPDGGYRKRNESLHGLRLINEPQDILQIRPNVKHGKVLIGLTAQVTQIYNC